MLDVVVDLRRGSPTFGSWESVELDDERGHQLYIPVGFGHGFCVLSETADFVYKCTAYYDAATERGIRFDDPDVGVRWPGDIELLYSERDRDAPRARRHRGLAAVPVRGMSRDGRFAPSPTGTLHLGNLRTALLAWLFARTAGAGFLVRMEDLDQGRVVAGSAEQQLADLRALGLDWDGEVVFQSNRHDAYEAAIERLLAEDRLYECFCTRAEIRAAASAPHGPLPEGAYPGTCLRLTEGERRRKRAGGRPPALRVRAGAARIAFSDRLHGAQEGVVDDFVVRRNDGAPAYNLAVIVDDAWQGIGEVVRGDDLLDSTPAPALPGRGARARAARPTRTCRSCSGPTAAAWPSGTARSRSASSTPARPCAGWPRRWAWRARTSAAEMRERFDPAALPREPTRWRGRI